ncbi:MAG: NYN domain-containing protein [Lachnospiraceae bacterium]|nr:NYN domain-containing protein [Lachnospiraceae bacterium]
MKKKYLLVDGYNVLYGWKYLKELLDKDAEAARGALQDMLCNYQGFTKDEVVLVFDGYKNKNQAETVMQYHNITIIYTKEAQTADTYIEKINQTLAKEQIVRVVTSDFAQQKIILGQGATRVPIREFAIELKMMNKEIQKEYLEKLKRRNCLIDNLDEKTAAMLEKLRLTEDL